MNRYKVTTDGGREEIVEADHYIGDDENMLFYGLEVDGRQLVVLLVPRVKLISIRLLTE